MENAKGKNGNNHQLVIISPVSHNYTKLWGGVKGKTLVWTWGSIEVYTHLEGNDY